MKTNKISLLALFILCASSAMAIPHRWVVEVSRMVPEEVPALQGETIELYPEITAYGEHFVSDTYQLYYQTNGMGGLFFSGAITTNLPVLFTPEMDIGATAYSFFIGTTNAVGRCYRPNGTIRMKKSPGFSPNSIPLPVSRIDFAATAFTNAPWLLTESDPGIPSAVSTAVAQAGTNAQAIANAAQANAVAISGTNTSTMLISKADTNHTHSQYLSQTVFPPGTATNLYLSQYLTVPSGRIYTAPFSVMPGDISKLNYIEHTSDSKFKFFDLNVGTMAQSSFLIAPKTESIEWGSGRKWMYPADGTSNSVASRSWVSNSILSATAGIPSGTRTLIDSSSLISADWQNRYLYDYNGRTSVEWGDKILTSYHPTYGYAQSLDWANRSLMDYSEHTVMAWAERELMFPSAGVAMDWSVDNAVTINGNVSMPGSALAEIELHRDSFTNIIWRSVYSNGWMWLVAYTNYPAN